MLIAANRRGSRRRSGLSATRRAGLESVRAEEASKRLAQLDAEKAALEAQTDVEVERVGQLAATRVLSLVSAVIDGIWATAGLGPSGPQSGAGDGSAVVDAGSDGRMA